MLPGQSQFRDRIWPLRSKAHPATLSGPLTTALVHQASYPSLSNRVRCWIGLEIMLAGSLARKAPAIANGRCPMYAKDTPTRFIASSDLYRLQ